MLCMLVVYDVDGNIVRTVQHMVARDEDSNVVGLIDFDAHERNGGRMRDIIDSMRLDAPIPSDVAKKILGRELGPDESITLPPDHPFRVAHDRIAGSGTWPEWLGSQAHNFKVELDDNKRIVALVHKSSRVKRKRADIEGEIAKRQDASAKEAKRRGDEMRALAKAKGLPKNVVDAMPDPSPEPTDLRDLLGGPDRPLVLDENGRTAPRKPTAKPTLPIVSVNKADKITT